MKTYMGSSSTAPFILNLNTRGRWVVSLTPWPLFLQGERPQEPLKGRLGEPQSLSGHFVEELNLLPLSVYIWMTASGKSGGSHGSNYEDNCSQNWGIPKHSNLQSGRTLQMIPTLVPLSIQFNFYHLGIGYFKSPVLEGWWPAFNSEGMVTLMTKLTPNQLCTGHTGT
jgi:hypothetical protein